MIYLVMKSVGSGYIPETSCYNKETAELYIRAVTSKTYSSYRIVEVPVTRITSSKEYKPVESVSPRRDAFHRTWL